MDLLRAAILGLIQGLTEFLPVSSSGHLILVPALFGWPDQGLAFDVGLHLGTLVALLAYFWRDWAGMVTFFTRDALTSHFAVRRYRVESQLLLLIALGSIPAAVVGLLFDDWIEANVRQPWVVALTLAGVGGIMLLAERRGRQHREMHSIRLVDALIIGAAQATALIPGVSRSGATLTAGLFRGLTRESAARFAFLLGTPAFVGAALLKSSDLTEAADGGLGMLVVGFLMAVSIGFAAIHFLLRFLRTHTLVPFVVYRLGVAALTLIIGAIRIS